MEVGKKGKVHVEDIVFLIRKDPKKYARVKVRRQDDNVVFWTWLAFESIKAPLAIMGTSTLGIL